jgi:hypothetical protein
MAPGVAPTLSLGPDAPEGGVIYDAPSSLAPLPPLKQLSNSRTFCRKALKSSEVGAGVVSE